MKVKSVFVGLVSLAVSSVANAGGIFVPGTAPQAQARAGAFVAKADDPSALFHNPAGFSKGTGTVIQIGANFLDYEPGDDEQYDVVVLRHVLEHLPDWRGALVEVERVLRPGGLFCASVPRRWPEQICWTLSEGYYKVPGGHLRIFRSRELKREIEHLGFKHYARHWAHALHAPFWWLKCLVGPDRSDHPLVALYHRLLVWDMMKKPKALRLVEKLLNPLMGKSLVPVFRGKRRSGHLSIGWELYGNRAIRQGDWKLLDNGRGGWQLFNLAFKTAILTALTLGIYRFWAKTRIRNYV